MKKFILTVELNDEKDKRKAMKIVASLLGIDSITINMKEKNLTIVGTVDPVSAVSKLRKFWPTYLVSVGPAKEPEPEKKEEPKKEEEKKEEGKEEPKKEENKEEPKKDEPKKEEDAKEAPKDEETKKEESKEEEKKSVPQDQLVGMVVPYRPYYPQMHSYYNYHPPPPHHHQHQHIIEENSNACVIC
ncbi:heavy metal-associated isoprenylated plant protein 39-like [Rutidosis leptorrhynchoides]|uniref:heavy metal-associated isoprenylated plant protein 39-like n=1 Tax=Rutidosis leptorrhynchoides TaxID=125765 RepID=UPI003A990A7D